MKQLLISLFFFSIISCDDKLTQSDCERITDEDACVEKGCVFKAGRVLYTECGGSCLFSAETDSFSGCFLSDTRIEEQMPTNYYRPVGDQYQIIEFNSGIGNLTGWENGIPECVTCTWE